MINTQKMGEKSLSPIPDDISVVDVYDLASDIGKECEKIIDCYGAEAVTSLMPKVVNALEWLESLASRNENENTTIQMLSDRVTYLEGEKLERAVYRERLQKELETIEEQWHNETKELREMVNRLQEENRRLKQSDTAKQMNQDANIDDKSKTTPTNLLNESDYQKLQRLRGQMEKQRDELMCRDQEIEEKNSEIENFNIQLERLKNSSRDSRKRQKMLQNQVRTLLDERSDLLLQIQDQTREINVLRRSIGFGETEPIDLIKSAGACSGNSQLSNNDLKQLLIEKDSLKAKIKELELELKDLKPVNVIATQNSLAEENTPDDNKKKIDGKENGEKEEDEIEEDPPVQGPLPYEPDDAPWKRTKENSGIRKFFRKLFTDQSTSNFPRRSLSTFSKMAISSSPSRNVAI